MKVIKNIGALVIIALLIGFGLGIELQSKLGIDASIYSIPDHAINKYCTDNNVEITMIKNQYVASKKRIVCDKPNIKHLLKRSTKNKWFCIEDSVYVRRTYNSGKKHDYINLLEDCAKNSSKDKKIDDLIQNKLS
ncbi:hypothetical protein A3715_17625 [Oleiphilus sp. HI0009]|nr:hypothetical protein A3715_17625 [Oleiphilus sp. HI0009]